MPHKTYKSIFYSSEQSPLFRGLDISFMLTSRLGGNSKPPYDSLNLAYHTNDTTKAVAQNRAKILSTYFPKKRLIFCDQVHSNTILTPAKILSQNLQSPHKQHLQNPQIQGLLESNLGQGDGIFCTNQNLVALILVADCNPVLIYDSSLGAFVALHAGRAGVCANILTNGVETLLAQGANVQNLRVFIGASIRVCCYEVGDDLAGQIMRDFDTKYIQKRSGKYFLDLPLMLRNECENLGILRENIEVLNVCSCCEKGLFSYRRAYKKHKQSYALASKNTLKQALNTTQDKNKIEPIQTGRFGLFVSLK